jgi:tetratricopeptide (TPR) repeat protein
MKIWLAIAGILAFAALGFGQKSLEDYRDVLKENPKSSAAHYGIAEIYFGQRNYQMAANEFRNALLGDLDPKWTKVWSYIYLGKIFDITGQRDRAVNEYNLALNTKDNTRGALEEAQQYLETPYQR